jgi:hypothetical protein
VALPSQKVSTPHVKPADGPGNVQRPGEPENSPGKIQTERRKQAGINRHQRVSKKENTFFLGRGRCSQMVRQATELLTPKVVAALLSVKVETLEVWRSSGRYPDLPYIKLGHGIVRYRARDVEKFISERVVDGRKKQVRP